MPINQEQINLALRDHQHAVDNWGASGHLIKELLRWVAIWQTELKLCIRIPALKLAVLHRNCHGHFCVGRNEFGLIDEIAINLTYVQSDEFWQVVGTLLHELLHLEEQLVGQPCKHNHHGKAFRRRAADLGLIVDRQGCTTFSPPPSPFFNVLDKYGIPYNTTPVTESQNVPPPASKSKLKLWICSCEPKPVRVRVAIEDFQAQCLKCGQVFRRVKWTK